MVSPVDICNMALADIGARSTISSFNEGTPEAKNCAIWYDRLRQSLLRAAPWGFARRQISLSMLGQATDNTSIYPWPFKYAYPPDCLRMRYILPPNPRDFDGTQSLQSTFGYCGPSRNNRFLVANEEDQYGTPRRVVLTTVQYAQGVYILDVTEPDLFDSQFQMALAAMLSYKLCIPISGNVQMRGDFRATADQVVIAARAADGNEANPTTNHTPDWITARGYSDVAPNVPMYSGLGNWFIGWDDLSWGA